MHAIVNLDGQLRFQHVVEDRLLYEEDALGARISAHQMLRALEHELPSEMAEAKEIRLARGSGVDRFVRMELHCGNWDCNSRARPELRNIARAMAAVDVTIEAARMRTEADGEAQSA